MKKINSTYIDNLVQRVINETLEKRADSLVSKIKTNVNELGGMDDGHPRFGKLNLSTMTDDEIADLMSQPMNGHDDEETIDLTNMTDDDTLEVYKNMSDDDFEEIDEDDCMECGKSDMYESSEVCECGGGIYEGECMECGASYMEEGIHDEEDINGDFDYVDEEDDTLEFEDDETEEEEENKEFCKYQKKMFGPDDERYTEKCLGKSAVKDLSRRPISMNERLRGNQSKIDRNKNGKIDAEDFKMLRGKNNREMGESRYVTSKGGRFDKENMPMSRQDMEMGMNNMPEFDLEEFCSHHHNMDTPECQSYYNHNSEVDEGNAFTGALANAKKRHKDKFNVDGKKFHVKESVKLTESEIIDLIEKIVLEQKEENKVKSNIKTTERPKGLAAYEKAVKGSKKENDDYIKSVAKKMKDYLKDGSKGEYETNPKHFPKGNGQLAKMAKKAYEIDEEGTDFNREVGGLNIPDYDNGGHPKKETIEKQIKGSSDNGNNPKWANAEDTGVNDKFSEYFENDQLAKWKDESYGRVPSPVYGETPKKSKKVSKSKLKEEFEIMKSLISYDRKTQ